MLFMAYCLDKPGAITIRMANRPDHVEYLAKHNDKLVYAGPLLNHEEEMMGSLLVLDVANRAEMDRFLHDDPYAKAGLFQSVSVHGTKKAFPR
jgi:uncharacterized protein YciI